MAPKSNPADFEELGLIALKLVKTNMIRLRSHTQYLLKNNEHEFNDSYVKEALKNCIESYSEGIDKVKLATKTYKVGDFTTVTENMSAVFDSVLNCEDGFDEKKGIVSPLKKLNQDMRAFNDLALYFTKDLGNETRGDNDWDHEEFFYDLLD